MAKTTKAMAVREIIAAAKAKGLTAADVVADVVMITGLKRQLARVYLKNNWDKVTAPVAPAIPEVPSTPAAIDEAAAKLAAKRAKDAARKREKRAAAKAAAVAA